MNKIFAVLVLVTFLLPSPVLAKSKKNGHKVVKNSSVGVVDKQPVSFLPVESAEPVKVIATAAVQAPITKEQEPVATVVINPIIDPNICFDCWREKPVQVRDFIEPRNPNAALGYQALLNIQNGFLGNTAIGAHSLPALIKGRNNTAIGVGAGVGITGDYNIVIGAFTDVTDYNKSGQLNIGNTIFGDLIGKHIAIGTQDMESDSALTVGGNTTVRGALSLSGNLDAINSSAQLASAKIKNDLTAGSFFVNGNSQFTGSILSKSDITASSMNATKATFQDLNVTNKLTASDTVTKTLSATTVSAATANISTSLKADTVAARQVSATNLVSDSANIGAVRITPQSLTAPLVTAQKLTASSARMDNLAVKRAITARDMSTDNFAAKNAVAENLEVTGTMTMSGVRLKAGLLEFDVEGIEPVERVITCDGQNCPTTPESFYVYSKSYGEFFMPISNPVVTVMPILHFPAFPVETNIILPDPNQMGESDLAQLFYIKLDKGKVAYPTAEMRSSFRDVTYNLNFIVQGEPKYYSPPLAGIITKPLPSGGMGTVDKAMHPDLLSDQVTDADLLFGRHVVRSKGYSLGTRTAKSGEVIQLMYLNNQWSVL